MHEVEVVLCVCQGACTRPLFVAWEEVFMHIWKLAVWIAGADGSGNGGRCCKGF